ncbi:hypothetical protein [Roseateles albus]|uniref:Uncharacterized protein n=1 Tax=Roseateles albus TaxID=2987525 RepID=A0ABT5KEJ7_9BURK|nr:hypothetical protein [Roseateles albus]MDC8772348.1 hypothetical protein [Roseateles albus]
MSEQLISTARLVATAALAAVLISLQACGGGGDPAPEPPKAVSYDLQLAMTQYFTKANSWTLSGTVSGARVPTGTAASMVLTIAPKSVAGTFSETGKQISHMTHAMTLSFPGFSESVGDESVFDPSNIQFERLAPMWNIATTVGDMCDASLNKGSFSKTAKVGDTGSSSLATGPLTCNTNSSAEVSYLDTWVVKQEGARVLLCLERNTKVIATGFMRTGRQCHQLNADSSLGSYMSFSKKLEEFSFELTAP